MGKLGFLSLESTSQGWMGKVRELPLRLDRGPTKRRM